MRISRKWFNQFMDVQDLSIEEMAKRITDAGFEVEGIEHLSQGTNLVIGHVETCTEHPDSDHLNICQVQISDDKTVQIVAGAPNAAVGLKTIVALPGAMMPNGSLIFPGALRGEKSFGMMCSPRELALPNAPQKRGIIELDDTAVVGEAFNPAKHWKG